MRLEQWENTPFLEYFEALLNQGEVQANSSLGRELRTAIDEQNPRLVLDECYQEIVDLMDCDRCSSEIPGPELMESLDNGGLCSWCAHMEGKDD